MHYEYLMQDWILYIVWMFNVVFKSSLLCIASTMYTRYHWKITTLRLYVLYYFQIKWVALLTSKIIEQSAHLNLEKLIFDYDTWYH